MDVETALGLVAMALVVGAYGTVIGAGGGFLLIPGLVLVFGLQGAEAVGTGSVTLVLIRMAGTRSYDRQGLVARPVALWYALGSVPVALFGSWQLTNRIESDVLLTTIGCLMVVLAVVVLTWRPDDETAHGGPNSAPIPPRVGPLLAGSVVVGFLTGTFAVGGGLLTVPYLMRMQRLTAHQATATTLAWGIAVSAAAVAGHALAGNIVWSFVPLLLTGAVVGSTFSANRAGRLSPRVVLALLATGLMLAGFPLIGFAQWR